MKTAVIADVYKSIERVPPRIGRNERLIEPCNRPGAGVHEVGPIISSHKLPSTSPYLIHAGIAAIRVAVLVPIASCPVEIRAAIPPPVRSRRLCIGCIVGTNFLLPQ